MNHDHTYLLANESFAIESATIIIPRGRKGLAPITMDIQSITQVLSRIKELEALNVATYPEFITSINLALVQAGRLTALVEIEYKEALNSLDVAEAIARLEKAESVLQSKGVKSSADTRDAAVTLDPDVQEAIQRKDVLAAMFEWVKHLRVSVERLYFSAKQVMEFADKSKLTMQAGSPESVNGEYVKFGQFGFESIK